MHGKYLEQGLARSMFYVIVFHIVLVKIQSYLMYYLITFLHMSFLANKCSPMT